MTSSATAHSSMAQVTTLANGLRIVSDPMPHLGSLALGVWVEAGGRDETPELMGISHMLEHMAFKGTARRSARDIVEEVEAVGGYLNAYTGRARTAYYMRLLKEDLALGVDLLADILRNPLFDLEELERERGVITQEIGRALDTPEDLVHDHLQAASYPDQSMGWPILGTVETVSRMSEPDLRGYIGANYRPDRMIISAAGALDHDALVREVEKGFGSMERGGALSRAEAQFHPHARMSAGDHEQLHLALGFANVPVHHKDFFTGQIYSEILGGGMSSRLFQSIREDHGLAYSVGSSARSFEDGGQHIIYAGTGPEQGAAVLKLVAEDMKAMAESVTDQEVDRAKAQIRAGLLMGRETPSERCETAVWDLLREGHPRDPDDITAHVNAVTTEAVRAHAEWVFTSSPPAMAAVGPEKSLPDYEGYCAMLRA